MHRKLFIMSHLNLLLHTQAAAGNLSEVKELLKLGADINYVSSECSVLVTAASKNHHKVVKFLIANGATVDWCSETDGKTALMCASQFGHHKTVQILLKAGARVDLQNKNGKSALAYAIESEHTVEVLEAQVDLVDEYGKPVLAYASKCVETVKLLLRHGAQVDLTDNSGRSPLSFASA